MTDSLDLSTIFNEVAKTLVQNQADLNAADTYNHDHGTNMVQTFKTVQKAVAKQKDKPVSEQLAYASETLKKKSTSGSAQIYAEGLANAANQFQGKELTRSTAGTLINAMMGMQGGSSSPTSASGGLLGSLLGGLTGASQPQTQSGGGDLLGSLLGGLTGQQQAPQTQQSSGGAGDLLSTLLGGQQQSGSASQGGASDLLSTLLGGQQQSSSAPQGGAGDLLSTLLGGQQQTNQPSQGGSGDLLTSLLGGLTGSTGSSQQADNGLDLGDLLSAGLAYYSAMQSGSSNLEAIMQALGNASPLGKRDDRKQSGALVINTILSLLGKKK